MKRFRIPLLIAAVFVTLLGLGLAVLFSASFQTWMARRALASRTDVRGTIGEVSAGLGRVEIREVRLERDGAVLTIPAAELEVPLLAAAFREDIAISRLTAKGWTLDLSKWNPPAAVVSASAAHGATKSAPVAAATPASAARAAEPPPAPPARGVPASPAAAAPGNAKPAAIPGVLDHVKLPFDLAVDGLDLGGDVVLPEARGGVRVSMTGGGLAAGKAGRFAIGADAALSATKVSQAGLRGNVVVEMDTPRSVRRVAFTADATAAGTQFPNGIKLATEAAVARGSEGESYAIRMISEGRQVLAVQAELPRNSPLLTGTWKADVRHDDLAPFAMGRPLPAFSLVGEGRFDTDAALAAFHAAGRASGTASELDAVMPQLSEVGAIMIAADFDVGRRGTAISIRKLEADLAGEAPVARLRALQAFEFNPSTAELRAENAERDLFDLVLHGLPVAWLRPFSPPFVITGGEVRGELVAIMRAGGATLRTKTPLTVDGVSVAQQGKPLVEGVSLALTASADYTPHGWQAEIGDVTVRCGDTTLLAAAAKAGQLPGDNQPLKATGRLTADLAAVLAQPVAAGMLALTRGEAAIDFAASLGATKEMQAKIALVKLVAPVPPRPGKEVPAQGAASQPAVLDLPAVTTDVRVDLAPDGQIAFNAPLVLARDSRKSDLTIAGTLKPAKNGQTFDAQMTSEQLVIEDAKVLAALLPPDEPEEPSQGKKPVWAGLRGQLALRLKKVVYSDTFQASDVAGTLRLDEGAVKFEGMRMGVGEGGAQVDGVVSFDARQPQSYGVAATVAMHDVDPGPLLRALNPGQLPAVEGKFTVKSELAGRAESIKALAPGVGGQFEVTSRGGVFRALPVNVGSIVESTNKLSGWLASAGSALGALTGKKDFADVTSKAQAVAEFAKGLNPIAFDQLNVVMSRDAARNTTLKDFTLISPEIRLSGEGELTHRPGNAMLDDALSVELTLRARGRQGDLLKYLGVLEAEPDPLGYSACTVPFKVGGTLGAPDTSELNQRLLALALEKTGVGDKAAELLQKIRGGKPTGED